MNEDITFTTLLNGSWSNAQDNIDAAKADIRQLQRDIQYRERDLEGYERELAQIKRFYNDYARPFDDAEDMEPTIEIDGEVTKGTRINVDIAMIAQAIADDFIEKLKASAPVDNGSDTPGRWMVHPYGFDYEVKDGGDV